MTFSELLKIVDLKVSDEQLAAIMSDTSAVVSAGAGSGKTTVLSLRFVRLVLAGKAHADEILTLTFTKKAAAEMYERIYSLLSEAAASDSRIKEELDSRFPRARISTMDSFWSEIARTASLQFGITRDFQSLEGKEGEAEDLVREIYDSLQEKDELQEGFMILSALYTSSDIIEMLGRIASEETDILTTFDATVNTKSYNAFIDLLENLYGGSRAKQVFSSLSALNERYPENGLHEEIDAALEAYRINDYSKLPALNLRKVMKSIDKEVKEYIKEADIKGYFENLKALQALVSTREYAMPVSAVIEAFITTLQSRKRMLGLLSYRDTESLCREVLISNIDVRDYYKKKFKYIMVDEFQDNNSRQRDLLYLLSEHENLHSASIPDIHSLNPDKLFFVGDDKQSIYYFRGADVSVFRSLKDDIGAIGGKNLSLSENYRSEPALINHFNSVFSNVFNVGPSDDDIEKETFMSSFTGEEYTSFYADSETIKAREARAGIEPKVELFTMSSGTMDEGLASAEDSEAVFIAKKIIEITGNDDYLISDGKGGTRRPAFRDIAILLRTTAPQMPIERAFRLFGIPYTVQESTSATIEGVGWDIYAFLQILVYPEDRLSYMAVLRSPFARISDDGLLFFADDKAPAFSSSPVFSSESDRESYENAKSFYKSLRDMVGRRRISEIVNRLFYEGGYSAYLHSSAFLEAYSEHFNYIWSAAVLFDSSNRSLPAFLDYLRPLVGQAGKLKTEAVQHLETDGVQIMTIHRSKGLQFPVVFISDADHGSGNQGSRNRLIAFDGKNPCIIPDLTERDSSNLILRESSDYSKRREMAELRRLLYVAMTRAIDHIIVTAHMRNRRTGVSLLDIYREGFAAEVSEIPSVAESELFRNAEDSCNASWYEQKVSPAPIYFSKRFGVKDASRIEIVGDVNGEELSALPSDAVVASHGIYDAFGTLVHSSLESVVKGEETVLSYPSDLTDEEKKELSESLLEIKQGFIDSAFFKGIIAGKACETEVRFFYPMNGGVAEGSVDLLVHGDDWNLVVDYKTDRFMNAEQHKGQIMAYAAAMESLYEKKCYALLLYVRGWKASTPIDKDGNDIRGLLQL